MSFLALSLILASGSPLKPPVSPPEATLQRANYVPQTAHYTYAYPAHLNYYLDDGIEALPLDVLLEMSQRARICEYNSACLAIYPISNESWAELTYVFNALGRAEELQRVLLEPEGVVAIRL